MNIDCSNCPWKHPDTCRNCRAKKAERQSNSRILFNGKARDMTRGEINKAWYWGRQTEPLEIADFGTN